MLKAKQLSCLKKSKTNVPHILRIPSLENEKIPYLFCEKNFEGTLSIKMQNEFEKG